MAERPLHEDRAIPLTLNADWGQQNSPWVLGGNRVWNDHGSFQIGAKVTPAMPPGEALVYHAWEPYQFKDWRGNMEVVSSPYKPTHFAGDYGHLRYRLFFGGPVHVPRGIPIDIAPA